MQTENEHHVKIILNLEEIHVHSGKLSYEAIARLAYPGDPHDPDIIYTITVIYPHSEPRSLSRGDKPVDVKEGMVIHARKTGRS